MLIWCSALLVVALIADVAILMLIPYYESLSRQVSYFAAFHFLLIRLVPLISLCTVVLICGLISFFHDKKKSARK